MADISNYILGFLGGTLGCSAQPNKAQESPEQVTPNTAVQCNVPTCESATPVLDTYISDENKLIAIYENDEGGCIVSGDYGSEILERCSAYYTETLAKYRTLFEGTKARLDVVRDMAGKKCLDDVLKARPNACAYSAQVGDIIKQFDIVKKRLTVFNNMVEITKKLENLTTASKGLRTKLNGYVKARNDARLISKLDDPIIAKLHAELVAWQREYKRTKNDNASFQAEARKTDIEGYQKQINDYNATETAAKKGLTAAVGAYEFARSEFNDAHVSADVGFFQDDPILVNGDKTLSDAKKALTVEKKVQKKDGFWKGW